VIKGVGVDLVTISRIESVHVKHGERFARRILGSAELDEYRLTKFPGRFLAKRFAAKEAAAKALGTGERDGILFKDFCVEHDELGKPLLQIHGKAAVRAESLGISTFHLSLSDEANQVSCCCALYVASGICGSLLSS